MLAFGPVPSRRLGRSLGVNNIPAKTCSYSCVYCQLGRTVTFTVDRRPFYSPKRVFREVASRVKMLKAEGVQPDYISFVPDGEPTLDSNLGVEQRLLGRLGIPLAILTNSSLLWREDVREELAGFNLVSVKIDAVTARVWSRINRPHRLLDLDKILNGISVFSRSFKGKLITETMVVDGVDYRGEFEEIADFLSEVKPNRAYIAVPIRPPAESWVKPPSEEVLNRAFQVFTDHLGYDRVELLTGVETGSFGYTGRVEEDILGAASVHPIREDLLENLLAEAGVGWDIVEKLIGQGKLVRLAYRGCRYYMAKIPSRS